MTYVNEIGDRYRQVSILDNLGLAYHGLGREADAVATLNRALEIVHPVNDINDEAKVLAAIGLVLLDTGEPQKGLDTLLKSLELLGGTEDIENQASVLDNVGSAYEALGDYGDAESYFQQAEALGKKDSVDSSRAVVLNNLATLEVAEGLRRGASEDSKLMRLARASDFYNQALVLSQKIGDKFGEMHILTSEAVIASEQGKQQQALLTLQRCQGLASETGYVESRALLEHTIGTVYAKLQQTLAKLGRLPLLTVLRVRAVASEGSEASRSVSGSSAIS